MPQAFTRCHVDHFRTGVAEMTFVYGACTEKLLFLSWRIKMSVVLPENDAKHNNEILFLPISCLLIRV